MKHKIDITRSIDGKDIVLTHLQKLFWPTFTKGQMLDYYTSLASTLLPYCMNRPVTAVVFPDGVSGISFYLRTKPKYAPKWIDEIVYQPKTVEHLDTLPIISNTASLLWFVNDGAIELHLWTATKENLTIPDMAIFDLDPGEHVPFSDVCDVAMLLYEELEKRYIHSFAKTTGGRGMHVYVPIEKIYTFEEVRIWVKEVGKVLAKKDPKHIALPHGNTHTGNMVTIDDGQNVLTRNTVAPYSLRAHKQFPVVSMPLTWTEVQEATIEPTDFTPDASLSRIATFGDIFSPVLSHNQKLI